MRKSGSGSSILKPQKPRQPLQIVNFDSPSDESNPVKIKRRVSFAEKKHVKEFCHSTEQGTVWDNTYEEHDCSSKGSLDQNATNVSSKKISEYISKPEEDMYITVEDNLNCSHDSSIAKNKLNKLTMIMNEEDNSVISDIDCTSPVTKCSDNCSQVENILPLDTSLTFISSPSSDNVTYNFIDKESQQRINMSPSVHTLLDVSKNAVPSNIIVYRDSDEEDCIGDNYAKQFKLSTNDTCKLNKTCLQDASMELTTVVSVPVSSQVVHSEERNITQNDDKIYLNDLHTNCTTYFNNVSVEITQVAPTTKQFTSCDSNTCRHTPTKVLSCESAVYNVRNNAHNDTIFQTESQTTYINDSMVLTTVIPASADVNCTNNIPLNMSMDITTAVAGKILERNVPHLCSRSVVTEKDRTEETEYFADAPMTSVNMLPSNVYDKENPRLYGAISADDKTFFDDASMEITKVILPRNQEGSTNSIICKSVCEENIQREEVASTSTCLNKDMRFLHESMGLIEAVPNSLYNERTLDALVSDTMQNLRSPAKNIAHSMHQTDYIFSNEKIQDVLYRSTRDITPNKLQNVIVPENKCLSTSDAILSPRSVSPTAQSRYVSADLTKSTCPINAIAGQTTQDASMEITTALPLTSHLAYDVTVEGKNNGLQHSTTKNPAKKSAQIQENLTVSTEILQKFAHNKSSNISIDSYLSDNPDYSDKSKNIHIYEKNFQSLQKDNVCEVSKVDDYCTREHFVDTIDRTETNLRDSLRDGNNECSFIRKSLPCLENSCDLQSINPPSLVYSEEETLFHDALVCNDRFQSSTIDDQANSAQSVTNKTTESEHPTESEKNIEKDNENFALLSNKNKLKIDKNESINIENNQTKYRHGNIEETHNTEDKEVNVQTIEKTSFIDSQSSESPLNTTGVQDLNKQISISAINITKNKAKLQQSIERIQDHGEENPDIEKSVSIEEKSLTEKDHFLLLSQKLETYSERNDCIWNVFLKNIDRKMIAFGFMANSLLIAAFVLGDLNCLGNNPNKRIKIISRLTDKADVLIRIVHKVLLQKVNAEILEHHKDIFSMLDFMSQEVKLTMDFMFDLRRLSDLNLIEITSDKISFMSLSKRMNIILKITIEIKVFDELTPSDINVCCVLGTVREMEVKNLIKSIKKDYKFLRRYMTDVKNYIDIIEDVTN